MAQVDAAQTVGGDAPRWHMLRTRCCEVERSTRGPTPKWHTRQKTMPRRHGPAAAGTNFALHSMDNNKPTLTGPLET